ncbi:stress response translation initiation inhibitor YciH [Psychrosphaera sp. F3M07]|uniref:stress response translation initiation inhibitor YciH n=1 Tax=Psychrosphaera sp. F3M07 TaxID=2841560 RepID=UPI001C08D8AE|nr:stress response translation initiation inhibitor YciH [Psychrosphaera sp. F3M07]MBU2917825.1 stress response translation initiation inhibitor YciH [Psychrosphaera sp. F3M07]
MSDWQDKLSTLVYSTDGGKVDNKPKGPVILGESLKDGVVKLTRQTKGRKGKGVIIIEGIVLPESEFKKMAQTIKKKCGTGGAVKDNTIEIQGDDRERVKSVLESLGYVCKLAGG